MASLEALYDLFHQEMLKRGITELPNDDFVRTLAPQLADLCAARMNARDDNDDNDDNDYLPVFSPSGTRILPKDFDHSFETLEQDSGE